MNYAIQCTDHASSTVGSFTFDEAQADQDGFFTAVSPVFPDLDALFKWAKQNGVDLACRIYNFPTPAFPMQSVEAHKALTEARNRKGVDCYRCGQFASAPYVGEPDGHVRHSSCEPVGLWKMENPPKRFAVDFDGQAEFTLDELFADGEADQFLARAEVEAMALDQVICFGGGAAPNGTITRIN